MPSSHFFFLEQETVDTSNRAWIALCNHVFRKTATTEARLSQAHAHPIGKTVSNTISLPAHLVGRINSSWSPEMLYAIELSHKQYERFQCTCVYADAIFISTPPLLFLFLCIYAGRFFSCPSVFVNKTDLNF